ncbi:hypothetical protein BZA05DRAFT_399615 [Tricharina praecox]|uniref:uncharacterized protein n=1 Tax=Tricharina praecox TaxID=43433 RepID=UPI00221EA20E|nr:uncharacterized protein BZA05DRAFT_399615 [Tricharina praecox]KAI5851055.1 hypothetical protein BZA05DRAFT_399615 [Tricharina praecox]
MLERVAVHHLESSGLRLLRGGRPRKRTLHTAFWMHGGVELDIAAAAASLVGGSSGGCSAGEQEEAALPESTISPPQRTGISRRRADLIPLDFLYPSGALAFLGHLSKALPRREPVFSLSGSKREYSSAAQPVPPPVLPQAPSHPENQKPLRPPLVDDRLPHPGDKYTNFKQFMNTAPAGQYESAWYHYCNDRRKLEWLMRGPILDTPEKRHETRTLQADRRRWMASYLLASSHRQEWTRALSMVNSLKVRHRAYSDYEILVKCFLRVGDPNGAYQILEEGVQQLPLARDIGFEVFMRHHIMLERWDMVMKAWELLRGFQERAVGAKDRRRELNTTALPSLGNPDGAETVIRKVIHFVEKVAKPEDPEYDILEGELAEDLLKGCLSYVTRPHAKWTRLWEEIWSLIESRGWLITKSSFERAVAYLAGVKQDALATKWYFAFRERGPEFIPVDIMNKILRCFARLQDYDGMQQVFDDIYVFSAERAPSRVSYSILMAAVAKRGDAAAVHSILLQSLEQHAPESPQEINHIMQSYVERGEIHNAIMWFERISDMYGLKPDIISYNTLINAYSRAGDVDGAALRVQEMLDKGIKPDRWTYNILLNMCGSRGDIAGAENIFDMIVQSGYEPDSYSYQALITAYVTAKELDKAEALLGHIAELNPVAKSTPIWNTIIAAHAAKGNDARVSQIFQMMSEKEVPFDYYTYGIVMHSLCVAGRMESAEETLQFIKDSDFHISSDKYAILMVGYTRLGDFRKVWETFQRMLNDGLKADFNTLAVLLKSYAHAEVEEFADLEGDIVHLLSTEKILDEATNEPVTLDLNSFSNVKTATPPWLFTPLINVYFKKSAWDRAIDVFNRFLKISSTQKYGSPPNLQMYKAMMQVYRAGGDIEGVRSMWQGLRSTAIHFHKSIDLRRAGRKAIMEPYRLDLCGALSILIRGMADIKDIKAIELEIESLQKAGYELDNVNWNDYVQALILTGELKKAVMVCEKNLMKYWKELRLYFFYSDVTMRGGEGGVMPPVRPFIRTIEAIGTELKRLDERRKAGDDEAKAQLVAVFRDAPTTWEACDGLEDMESRASKEMVFRLQRKSRSGEGDRNVY